jgi:DNA-binding response OmpR family regulator
MNSVLLIDDEEKLRQLLPRISCPEGFSQQEAATGPVHSKQPLPKSST